VGDNSGKVQSRIQTVLTQVGSFALAIILLYLALRNVDLGDLWFRIKSAAFGWLIPLTVVVFLSHLIRAWRWRILLQALPGQTNRPIKLLKLFGALMAGYMVNYAAPRLGELVRTSIATRICRQRFASVLGTVVAERMLDVVSLALALITVLLILRQRLGVLFSTFELPSILTGQSGFLVVGAVVALVLAAAFAYRRSTKDSGNGRYRNLIASFADGLRTLIRSGRAWSIAGSTVVMWVCYLMMAYIPLRMLGLTTAFDLGVIDAWSLMNIGALGVVVPSPGGTGTYHYITQLALTELWSVPADAAAAYAILTHAIQMILYVAAGFISLVVLGIGIGTVLSTEDSIDRSIEK
jgi:uncharacterized protein (TIRG00374 family)